MVVIDSTNLLLMLRPGTRVPNGPDGSPISRPKDRIDYLVQRLSKAKSKIIIPTPVLSEALVKAGPLPHKRSSKSCKSTPCLASSPSTRARH
jgi:hypothetical protein